jgi:uncharacterized glyoxalase superfamily protein PhnB
MTRLLRLAPELPVVDVDAALEHYAMRLGFDLAMRMPDGDYAIVERDGVAIHLFADRSSSHTAVSVHVFADGLDALFAELQERGAEITQPIASKPWGNRDFRIADLSGNEIKSQRLRQRVLLNDSGIGDGDHVTESSPIGRPM